MLEAEWRETAAGVRASGGVNQAEGQDHEDDQADDRVKAIALEGEADDGHGDPRDGRGDEEQQAELNQAQALKVRRGERRFRKAN